VTRSPGEPSDRRPPFKFSALTRVGFSDTDAQGVVYYGRYLPYFDLARTEYLRHLGLLGPDPDGHQFVMRAQSVVYEAPARFDDPLEVFVRVSRIGRTSMTFAYAAHHAETGALLCTAEQTLVLVDLAEHRTHPVREATKVPVADFEGADVELALPTTP
jgi:acyl-CoA thioester hydrolase